MSIWYVADGVRHAGVALGTGSYGTTPALAGKWVDFNTTGGVWKTKVATGDTIVFLDARYDLSAVTGGWTTLNTAFSTLTLLGQTTDGKLGFAEFRGTRTWPWPAAGDSAATVGETFMQLQTGMTTHTHQGLWFRNVLYTFTPAGNGGGPNLGTINQTDCGGTNVGGGLCYTQVATDGRLAINQTRVKIHGYSRGNAKAWAAINQTDSVFDSELQATTNNNNTAQQTQGANIKDAWYAFSTTTTPGTSTRCIYRNHAAGGTGGGYPQGDGFLSESNTGNIVTIDTLTYGNGDRGFDSKCGGTMIRDTCWGNGTGGIGHHNDNQAMNLYQCVEKVGTRPAGVSNASVCVQSSGLTGIFQSALICLPTAAQVANNAYGLTAGSNDITKFHTGSVYESYRQGRVSLNDVYAVLGTTAGATEQNGYGGATDNGHNAVPAFGLTPGNTYNLKIRALAQDQSASAYTSTVQFVMAAAGTGDVTGPAAPTGLTCPSFTSNSITLTWNLVPNDAGTSIQGTIFNIKGPGDAAGINTVPGKSAAPITLAGFKPASLYTIAVAAYDTNGNLGTFSSTINVTTAAGSTDTNTPGVPTSPAVADLWVGHSTVAGLKFTAPGTGTVAYYELADSGGTVLTRVFPITSAGTTTPTYTKTNVAITSV